MKGLILAAGEGKRMRPLTVDKPKPLLPLAGKPIIDHILDHLKFHGVREVYIVTGWESKRLKEHLKDGSDRGMDIRYLTQEERLGTAHAIGRARDVIDEPFICMNGDIVVTRDAVGRAVEMFNTHGMDLMAVAKVDDPSGYGVVEVDAEKVVRIIEKPLETTHRLVNTGLYIFNKEIFDVIEKTGKSKRGEYEITDSMQKLADDGKLLATTVLDGWIDVGRPWDLLKANEVLMSTLETRIDGEVEDGAVLKGPVVVGEGSKVLSGCYIEGPVIIGKGCKIGPRCYIRPSTHIGDDCHIGAGVELKNTIVMDHTNIPHLSYVGDSVIGERCNLGAGTNVANLRLDGKNIRVSLRGKWVDSGRRKLGVIMGHGVKTGINSSFDVGTIVGAGSFIGPGAKVSGSLAENSRVY